MSELKNFDLEAQVAEWRRALLASKTIGSEEGAELEDHLRQEIEHLTELGNSEEKAFQAALQKVGAVDDLVAEYGKDAPPWWNKPLHLPHINIPYERIPRPNMQLSFAGYLTLTKARPMRVAQPMGLWGVGAIIALIFSITADGEYHKWWYTAIAFAGLETLNQVLAWRFPNRVAKRPEPCKTTFANVLLNILCFLVPPLGLAIWLATDHRSPREARRAFRSSERGFIVALIIAQYALVFYLVNIACNAIQLAQLSPLDPVKVEKRYQQMKRMRRQKHTRESSSQGVHAK